MKRDSFGSRLGFIMVSAGCAIGIGNVWRFPYVAGENGGGIFVLFYLLFLACMGIPIMIMELATGRATRKTSLLAYRALEPQGSKWHIQGAFGMAGNYLLMMYYTTVAGWMVSYFFKFLFGSFTAGMDADSVTGIFNTLLANPVENILWLAIITIAGFLVCSLGLQNGLERVTKFMMSTLLVLMFVLVAHSFTLPGMKEGFSFYLLPKAENIARQGLSNVILAAMNQAFFTLSLGIGCMQVFGSYMSRDNSLAGEAVRICVLDTIVAISAGLIIFPACFSFGVQPDAGPSLIFVTLPNIFINMPGGRIWGALFFLFMTFAAFSTVIAVFENLLANCIDNFGWNRKKAVWINCIFVLLASLPCALGFNIWQNVHLLPGKNILDFEDFIVSNLLLPTGAICYLLFCVSKYGWGFDRFMNEVNTGTGMKFPRSKAFRIYLQFILPLLILYVLIRGLI